MKNMVKGDSLMKKFVIRQAETLKTTAAVYYCTACPWHCSGSGI